MTTHNVGQISSPKQLTTLCSPVVTKVASGTGVKVYKFVRFTPNGHHHSSPWAVKKVTCKSRMEPIVTQRLMKEAEILKRLKHENIIKLKNADYVTQLAGSLNLEFGGHCLKTILQRLSSAEPQIFDEIDCIKVVSDVIKALHYLHFDAFLLHGDIKSDNVLYNLELKVAKLCDFGVSQYLEPTANENVLARRDKTEEYIGSMLYRPKEINAFFEDETNSPVTDRCDIWAFGLLLYEIITLTPPYLNQTQNQASNVDFNHALETVIGTRPCLTEFLFCSHEKLLQTFHSCTEEDYLKRPSSKDLSIHWSSCA